MQVTQQSALRLTLLSTRKAAKKSNIITACLCNYYSYSNVKLRKKSQKHEHGLGRNADSKGTKGLEPGRVLETGLHFKYKCGLKKIKTIFK